MKVAFLNMENLFFRDERLIQKNIGSCLSSWIEEFERLMSKENRPQKNFVRLRELSFLLGFHSSSLEPYVVLRRKAGQLYMRRKNGLTEMKAGQSTGWDGWIKLSSRPINEKAICNKSRLISEINPDVLIVQEVEDRQSLVEFNELYLPEEVQFSNIYVMGGNDESGRELGILTKSSYNVTNVRNYADNVLNDGRSLFDLDFQEYELSNPHGDPIIVFSAFLCEKSSNREAADLQRKLQAEKIATAYEKRRDEGYKNIALAGTFNTPSYCDSLSPLLRSTDMKEIKRHNSFNVDLDNGHDSSYFSLGAYRIGVNTKQLDYLLLSPDLYHQVKSSGLNRKGIFPSKADQYKPYSTVDSEVTQASSHPMLWFNT